MFKVSFYNLGQIKVVVLSWPQKKVVVLLLLTKSRRAQMLNINNSNDLFFYNDKAIINSHIQSGVTRDRINPDYKCPV
jgi:hypothetical protein